MPPIQTNRLVSQENLKTALALFHTAGERGLTRAALEKAMSISYKTQDRILATLKEHGAVFETQRSRGVLVYVLKKAPTWDRRISPPVRLALKLAKLALSATGTAHWTELLQNLEQLADEKMTSRDRQIFEALAQAATMPGEDADIIEGGKVLEPLLEAIREQRLARITYCAAGARAAMDFEIVPYRLVHDLFAGGAFLLAWNPAHRKPKHYRLNRIDAVTLGRPAGLSQTTLDLLERSALHQVGGWTSGKAPFEVKVLIRGKHWVQALYEAPPALPRVQVELVDRRKAIQVTFWADHPAGVSRWILQFGSAIQVVSPESLRESIEGEWRKAIGQAP